MKEMEIKKYPLVTLSKEPGSDIVYVTFKENLAIDLEIAKELISNRLDFTKQENHFLIVDLTNIKHMSSEAKNYVYTSEDGLKYISGSAFIANNPVARLIGNVLVKTSNPLPINLFTDVESAYGWIKTLKEQ